MTESEIYPAELAVGVTSSRISQVSPAARRLHQHILRGFATTGHAPTPADLAAAAAAEQVGGLLRELHDHDVIQLDQHDTISAAYPFSAAPTVHVVAIDGGPTVHAMCAIDALGIAAMLRRDTSITTIDPTSGQEIKVTTRGGQPVWEPATAVAFVGSDTTIAGADCCTPSAAAAADRCCTAMNLFTNAGNAQQWITANPHVSGTVLTKEQALRLGADIFGPLLDQ